MWAPPDVKRPYFSKCGSVLFAIVLIQILHLNVVAQVADTTRILALAEKAYLLYNVKPDSSLLLAKAAEVQSRNANFQKGIGRATRVIGIHHWWLGNYDSALSFFTKALAISEQVHDIRNQADCFRNIAVVHRTRGNNGVALEYNFRALKLYDALNDLRGLANLNNNIGLIYKESNQHDKALEYLTKALDAHTQIADSAGIGRALGNIGTVYQDQKRYDKALVYQKKALLFNQRAGDLRGMALNYNNLAGLYIDLHYLDSAGMNLEKGLAASRAAKGKDIESDALSTMSKYYNVKKNYADGYKLANEAIAIAESIGNAKMTTDAYYEKYIAAAGLKRHEEALHMYEKYVALRDSVNNSENDQRVVLAEFTFKEERARIQKEKLELEHKAEKEHQARIMQAIAGVAFTSIIVAILVFINNKQIRAKKELLSKQQQQLELKNKELISSQEEIAAQRDMVIMQNAELREARATIEKQNEDIRRRNETLEDEVRERTRALSDYNEQLEQFAFISAHNLRAPVARILGLGELLKHGAEENLQIMDKMVSSAYELDDVVRQLNMILYIRNDRTVTATEVNVIEELDAIKSKLAEQIAKHHVSIETHLSATIIKIVKPYFQNILFTLIENAIKFRNPENPLHITVSTATENGEHVLCVADNGLGIDLHAHKQKLFTLYSRFHLHTEGKGIGLYLLKTQVHALKGRVEVESEVGRGSTFKVYVGGRMESEI